MKIDTTQTPISYIISKIVEVPVSTVASLILSQCAINDSTAFNGIVGGTHDTHGIAVMISPDTYKVDTPTTLIIVTVYWYTELPATAISFLNAIVAGLGDSFAQEGK